MMAEDDAVTAFAELTSCGWAFFPSAQNSLQSVDRSSMSLAPVGYVGNADSGAANGDMGVNDLIL